MQNQYQNDGAITLLSLNIERDEHLDVIEALIVERAPSVLCLQEVQKPFADYLAEKFGYDFRFSLRDYNPPHRSGMDPIPEGVLIAWHPSLQIVDTDAHVYNEKSAKFPNAGSNDVRRSLLVTTLKRGDETFRFGVSHFTWTPDGSASDEQREDMGRMLTALETYHDEHGIIFCGDFNAPRGGEIFGMMSARYADHLPGHITTTLDQNLHRAAPIILAVDGMFSTREYVVNNVEVVGGVSDHMALFAEVSKSVC